MSIQNEYLTIIDSSYTYISVSKPYLDQIKLEAKSVLGKSIKDIWQNPKSQKKIIESINLALSGKEVIFKGDFKFGNKESSYRVKYTPLLEKDGKVNKVVVSTLDISDEIDKINHLKRKLRLDDLTKLNNKEAFESDIKIVNKLASSYSLISIEIYNLSSVNEKFHCEVGDLVISKFAEFLTRHLAKSSSLYRIVGDKFIAISYLTNEEDVEKVSKNLIKKLEKALFNRKYLIGMSIGSVVVTHKTKTPIEKQIKTLESNLEKSKKLGKNKFTYSEI